MAVDFLVYPAVLLVTISVCQPRFQGTPARKPLTPTNDQRISTIEEADQTGNIESVPMSLVGLNAEYPTSIPTAKVPYTVSHDPMLMKPGGGECRRLLRKG
jgi:hypothetical protein